MASSTHPSATNGLPTTANGNGKTGSHGLDIVIIGAGIGGLTAAIYLRYQGHRVTVLEQSRFANEVGAAMHLAPNSNGLLRRIGIFAERVNANLMEHVSCNNSPPDLCAISDNRARMLISHCVQRQGHRI